MESKILLRIIISSVIIIACVFIKKSLKKEPQIDESDDNFEIDTTIDSAIDFGYKIQWYAIKTNDKRRVAEILKLKKTSNCNWETGIKKAYENSIFITPQVGDWTLVCGNDFIYGTEKQLLLDLSKEFGESQFFSSHRVSDYYCWMKALNGTLVRSFTYSDEYENRFIFEGNPTKIEKDSRLTKDAENDFEYIDFINEEFVIKIAKDWSINPIELSQRKDIKHELGIIGSL